MKRGETKADTFKRVGDYVGSRLAGNNKQESAQGAGYSYETSRKPSLIENTAVYAEIVNKTLASNGVVMLELIESLRADGVQDLEKARHYLDYIISKNS